MRIVVDMGTTNTRMYLVKDQQIVSQLHRPFGARVISQRGKDYLYQELHNGIDQLLETEKAGACDLSYVAVYGLGGNEYGVHQVEHIEGPVSAKDLAEGIRIFHVPQITNVPIWIIPGVIQTNTADRTTEMMRGEETEAMGFLDRYELTEDVFLILPGSHCKTLHISKDGKILNISSSVTGEMLQSLAENTILREAVDFRAPIDQEFLIRGAKAAEIKGVNCTLLGVRTLHYHDHCSISQTTSYFLGAVIGSEIQYIASTIGNASVYIGGNSHLKPLYVQLLQRYANVRVHSIDHSETMGVNGAIKLLKIRENLEEKQKVKQAINDEKIIVILRGLKKEDYVPVTQALYDGGIRLVEVTFDASGTHSDVEIGGIIRDLVERFSGRLHIGVGSVLKPEQVRIAAKSGAKFIISPHVNRQVIQETIELGLVSIPGCFTPTEVVTAYDYGADFIKVFPNELGQEKLIKAMRAPLPHIPLLAVGGVNPGNMVDMLKAGAVGLGMGSLFAEHSLIDNRNYRAITDRAKQCTEIIRIYQLGE